ncbi:MAG: hypothetical protein R2793_00435 [Flavobacteriaceae bacterium]
MNSYNENLHSEVLSSLQGQELDQKKKKAQQNAAMFSLYYAQGARITANEKLELSTDDMVEKGKVKEQAVNNSNISNNLLMAANQEKTYVSQAITNASVSAANVQIASNAIMKLASDIASVFSIVNAADFGGDIYEDARKSYELINRTAVEAEKVSQLAMDASSLTAQVSASTVADKAKATNTAVANLLSVANSEFDTVSATVTADNTEVATTSTLEKAAEGTLKDLDTDYIASQQAYVATNKALNLNLNVPGKSISSNGYAVHFDLIKSPFEFHSSLPNYPVESYNIMLVKERKKSVFNINSAERILLMDRNKRMFVKITPSIPLVPAKESAQPSKSASKAPQKLQKSIGTMELPITITELVDTDGEQIKRGDNYVVFVMAVFYTEYKKAINNFEDYLSAPSAPFSLTYTLKAPNPKTFALEEKSVILEIDADEVQELTQDNSGISQEDVLQFSGKKPSKTSMESTFTFQLNEDDNVGWKVEYRCMFLPNNPDITKGLLTDRGLRKIEDEINKIEKISLEYDPKIEALQTELLAISADQDSLLESKNALTSEVVNTQAEVSLSKTDAQRKKVEDSLKNTLAQIESIDQRLGLLDTLPGKINDLEKKKQNALKIMRMQHIYKPGLFFNLTIAEQVSAGNYTVASQFTKPQPAIPQKTKNEKLPKPSALTMTNWQAVLGPETTDNFGNPLIPGNSYIPVVLAMSVEEEAILAQYTNAISDHLETKPFIFQGEMNSSKTKNQ